MTLLDSKNHTATELAEKFEISTKTVYRQTSKLVSAGFPITTILGKNGGIMLANKYVCDTWFFSAEELSFIANIICSNKSINPQISNLVFEKIKHHISNNNMTDATKKINSIVVDNSQWFSSSNQNINKYHDIVLACENSKEIEIEYGEKKRVVQPYSIVFKENSYYLYAFCTIKQDFRLFKLDRILSYIIYENTFKKCDIKIENQPWNKTSFEKIEIVIATDTTTSKEISSWTNISKIDENKYQFTATYNHGLINRLIEYGNKIKIISPQKIISDVVKTCQNITNLYSVNWFCVFL